MVKDSQTIEYFEDIKAKHFPKSSLFALHLNNVKGIIRSHTIIREKRVDTEYLFSYWNDGEYDCLQEYNDRHDKGLTKEEYETLLSELWYYGEL